MWYYIQKVAGVFRDFCCRHLRGDVDWNCCFRWYWHALYCRHLRGDVDWNLSVRDHHWRYPRRHLRGDVDWNTSGMVQPCRYGVVTFAVTWIEIARPASGAIRYCVVTFAVTWIEISISFLCFAVAIMSSPSRWRGLKYIITAAKTKMCTSSPSRWRGLKLLAILFYIWDYLVVTFAVTWIEMPYAVLQEIKNESRHLRGDVDWNILTPLYFTEKDCRHLRGDVDWNYKIAYPHFFPTMSSPSRWRGLKSYLGLPASRRKGRHLRGDVDWNICSAVATAVPMSRHLRGDVDWNNREYILIIRIMVVTFAVTWIEIHEGLYVSGVP